MNRFRRLGLQRRIMLYVAIGLVAMFSVGAYLGFLAIHQATQLVYDERQGTAFATAAALESSLQELAHGVGFMRGRLLKGDSAQDIEAIGLDLLAQSSYVQQSSLSSFVVPQGLWLVDREGESKLALPGPGSVASHFLSVSALSAVQEPSVFFMPESASSDTYFGTLVVPVKDDAGDVAWRVILVLASASGDEPYLLPSPGTTVETAAGRKSTTSYGLEVLGPDGRVALTRRGGTPSGKLSPHWQLLQQKAPLPRGPFVFAHRPKKGQKFPPHVIAAAPLASGPYVAILEQGEDVALALPLHLRQRLILFAGLGFLGTMMVAWVTTRHVVQPTEHLTMAAQRIAEGKVDEPIVVAAQDEIGTLAESLETMRLRLQTWGSELEKQVQSRTSELHHRNRELLALYDTLRQKEEQLRALLAKVLRAQEDERRRVSQELHDGIGQAVSALTMGLEGLERDAPAQWPAAKVHVEGLRELAAATLADLRRLTVALRPAALDDLGLVPAIRRYAELYLAPAGIECLVEEEGMPSRFDPSLETVIYRVVQEAINNVARHSDARRVAIHLQCRGGALIVTVKDNGRGFNFTADILEHGVGLQGMQERASLAGGKLEVESQPGTGTTISLEIPLTDGVRGRRDG
ncbi:MAG: sensor histidine kinase [Chloroflexi bacterium]|nr:sensor histidine kinase [Chloroflexota bacterium]